MKRLALAMALVLIITIPASAQNWVGPVGPELQDDSVGNNADYGPIRMKPLMIHTIGDGPSAWFYVGQTIYAGTSWEVKRTGKIRIKIETCNSAGVLIDRVRSGWPDPLEVNSKGFDPWIAGLSLGPDVSATPGYYTVKAIYIDVATGNTWSHQTKIRVFPPL